MVISATIGPVKYPRNQWYFEEPGLRCSYLLTAHLHIVNPKQIEKCFHDGIYDIYIRYLLKFQVFLGCEKDVPMY